MRQEERQHFEAEIDVQSQENSLLVLIRRKEKRDVSLNRLISKQALPENPNSYEQIRG